jgi:DNA-binding MarR family transcriptional regulator
MLVDQPIDDRGALAINTQGLLMDAIRRIDEMKEFRKRLPSSRAYVARVKPAGPNLEPGERLVYEQCSGDRTVAELAQSLRLTEFDATKILHHLITSGLVAASPSPHAATAVPKEPTAEEIARIFNFVFREILSEVRKVNLASEFLASANGALLQQALKSPVLKGLTFLADGALADGVLRNLARQNLLPSDAARTLHAALSELMFFLLFDAGERLVGGADEDLSRRVKQLLATIEGAG